MKLSRLVLALTVLAAMAGLAHVAQRAEAPGAKMVSAAQRFLDSLSPEQRKKATFAFDSKERTNWHFVPLEKNKKSTRKGLPLEEMSAEQKTAALALVAAGTSDRGNQEAVTIMSLEAILRDAEKGKGPTRNPEWYFFTLFGEPSKTGQWGWRVEGHHLSLNFTLNGSEVVASTPALFGANPATVKNGPKKGLRTLAPAEDLPKKLLNALDQEQKKTAYRDEPFPEITQAVVDPKVGEPVGLPASQMTKEQKALLLDLLKAYTDRMSPEVAAEEMKAVRKGGIDNIHFAYTGGTMEGQKHTYRVQGPTFVIQFLNEQKDGFGNSANHIHSVWQRIKGNFAID
jgi:hypothetical protein